MMGIGYVLYNPMAGGGECEENARLLEVVLPEELRFFDITRITNYSAFLGGIGKADYLIIAGGDGTLNRFVNDTEGIAIVQDILYFPAGTYNNFARDMGMSTLCNPFPITRCLQSLPCAEINGKTYRFLNGVGFGLDGYCCQRGEKKHPGKKVNHTAIAAKGLLACFHARNARVTVDGTEYTYKKVWSASAMLGRFCGGMLTVPEQDRFCENDKLSLMVFHGTGRLRALCALPDILKGKHGKIATVHTGHQITVEFDSPTPLQIDGEGILNVTGYTVMSAKCAAAHKNKRVVIR